MAAKTKQVFEQIFKEVQHLQADIMDMTQMCQQRRETLEKYCGKTRELFKPWPSKVVQMCSPNDTTEEEIHESVEKPCSSLNAEIEKEKKELAMLDDILAKAQHARDLQNKMMKPGKKVHASSKLSKLQGNKQSLKTLASEAKSESKPKAKVSYPVLNKRPSSAKSTYAASYTKPVRTKTQGTGTKRTSSASKETPSCQPKPRKQIEEEKVSNIMSHETKMPRQNLPKNTNSPSAGPLKPTECKHRELDLLKTAQADTKFRISGKGATLSMPTEFLEICREQKRLLHRVTKAGSFTQSKSEEQFFKRAEELFCPTLLTLPSISELNEDICRLESEYGEVLSLVKNKGMQPASKKGEVDSFASWEATMSKFEELNHKVLVLKKNLDHFSKYCPFPEHKSRLGMVVEKPNSKYENERKLTSSFIKDRQKCLKSDSNGFFTYHNMKELKTLLQVTYDYKMMKYQLHLRKMVGETILPLLQQLHRGHNLFIPLCRSVYSILCCEGKTFPTVVKDSLPED